MLCQAVQCCLFRVCKLQCYQLLYFHVIFQVLVPTRFVGFIRFLYTGTFINSFLLIVGSCFIEETSQTREGEYQGKFLTLITFEISLCSL